MKQNELISTLSALEMQNRCENTKTAKIYLKTGEPQFNMQGVSSDFLNWGYIPYSIYGFENALKSIRLKMPELTEFLELGSGIGTKTLLAEFLGFKFCTGIEFNPDLIKQSYNIKFALFSDSKSLFIEQDLGSKAFFKGLESRKNTLVYFYSPFTYKESSKWIKKLVKHLPSGNVIYANLHCSFESETFDKLVKTNKLKHHVDENCKVWYEVI